MINEGRAAANETYLGFANPPLYSIKQSDAAAFHDIADYSTNVYYPAVTGFDDATGLGTINGTNLTADLITVGVPPLAPTNLRGAPQNTGVKLTWNASAGATGYYVWRSSTLTGVYTFVSATVSVSYINARLANGTTYYYEVSAYNSAGSSPRTAAIGVTPIAAPSLLTITAGPVVTTAPGRALISWKTNVNANSTVLYCLNSADLNKTVANGALSTAHGLTITGLVSKSKYFYQVQSMDGTQTATSKTLSWVQP